MRRLFDRHISTLVAVFVALAGAATAAAAWPNGYTYQAAITISHMQVPNSDEVNFPVLIAGTYSDLAASSGKVASPSGFDIVFAMDTAGASPLNFEREYYSTTGQVAFWVQVPILSGSTDTVLYMFYGNPSVTTDQSTPKAVWSGGYGGVWHLGNGTVLSAADSSGNGYNGIIAGAVSVAGKIDGGANFNGSNSYLSLPAGAFEPYPGNGASSSNASQTFSAWFKTTGGGAILGQTDGTLPGGTPSGWAPALYVDTSGYLRASMFWHGTNSAQLISARPVNDGNWHYVVETYGAGTERMYMDGQPVVSQDVTQYGYAAHYAYSFGSGDTLYWPSAPGGWDWFNGALDEARSANTVLSANWIAAEYNNQSNPAGFYSVVWGHTSGGSQSTPALQVTPASVSFSAMVGGSVPAVGSFAVGSSNTIPLGSWTASVPAAYQSWLAISNSPSGPWSASTTGSGSQTVYLAATITSLGAGTTNGSVGVNSSTANPFSQSEAVSVSLTQPSSGPTWPNGYTYAATITISHLQVPTADQANFPVLISGTYADLSASAGKVANPSGYDMVFAADAAGAHPLKFDREFYSSTGQVIFWVQVPVLSHTADTTIYMFYGNPSIATDQSTPSGVWSPGYGGVWHLGNGTSLSAADASGNGNNGTLAGAAAVAGEIDGGAGFNGSSGYISLPAASFVAYPSNGASTSSATQTFSTWFKTSSGGVILGQTDGTAPSGAPTGWVPAAYVDASGYLRASMFWHGSTGAQLISAKPVNDGRWHSLVDTYISGTETLYLDGQAVQARAASDVGYASKYAYYLGAGDALYWPSTTGMWYWFNGTLDEARASTLPLSASWIATEYNNQSSPNTFYSAVWGATNGGGSATPPGLSVTPTTLTFTGPVGGSNPPVQTLTVTSSNSTPLGIWAANVPAADQSWLSVSTSSAGPWASSASGTGAGTLYVLASTSGLGSGTTAGSLAVTSPSASPSSQPVGISVILVNPVTNQHYVSTTGLPSGDGSIGNPWDLQTALNQPASVQPGDTIWLRAGVYGSNSLFTSRLNGTSALPIIVRQYPGERATINGGFLIEGSYSWFWGFEVEGTVPQRITGLSGSSGAPSGLQGGFDVEAPGTKFINLVVHDTAQGFSFWTPAVNAEIYGSLIYNNGWQGTDRGHGHGIYTQNQTGTKIIADNVIFQGFGLGIQCYGSSAAFINNFVFDGNTFFNSGSLTGGHDYNLLVAGGTGPQNITVTNNYTYHTPSDNNGLSSLSWGFETAAFNLTATGNYWIGGDPALGFDNWNGATFTGNTTYSQGGHLLIAQNLFPATYTFDNNAYFGNGIVELNGHNESFANWQSVTGIDAHSTYTPGDPTGVWTFVRPNQYETGRANITIYNWALQNSVSVDLSKVLTIGKTFVVLNTQDFYGSPVVSGVYAGGALSIPMTGLTAAPAYGVVPAQPRPTGPAFGAFVVLQP